MTNTTDQPAFDPESIERFRYVGYSYDPASGVFTGTYALDDLEFSEQVTFAPLPTEGHSVDLAAVDRALWLLYLLAGVSYYKAAAPPVISVEAGPITASERALLAANYLDGLGEYAYRNGLDLSGVRIDADSRDALARSGSTSSVARPLIPFGGGLDSIVTVEGVREHTDDITLFVVSKAADRFEAIETAIGGTGLEVVRAERLLDPKILRSRELGYRNGHVPVTGVISAIAVVSALLDGRDAVIMSNEWSASMGNTEADGRVVNHQWSKSLAFEDLFRAALRDSVGDSVQYFSWLRPFSELWVAKRFESLQRYLPIFRSCNRAFHINPADRLDHWCGHCDKCAFIDLILSPYIDRDALAAIFVGPEPLENGELIDTFRALLGTSGDIKPFECVGDVDECRVALLIAAQRPDRANDALVQQLALEVQAVVSGSIEVHERTLLAPLGPHRIPDDVAPHDLLG